MPKGLITGCVRHPEAAAVAHCHQCSTPVCDQCVVAGPTGKFCSFDCRDRHEQFMKNAQGGNLGRTPGTGFARTVRKLIGQLVFLAIALFSLGILGTMREVPVLSALTRTVRGMIGL